MNSKLNSLLLILFLTSACGVKSPPVAPKGSSLPSYVDQFLDKPDQEEKKSKSTAAPVNP